MSAEDPPAVAPTFSKLHVAAAWGVHLYTALGLVLALASVDALVHADAQRFLLLNLAAMFIDGSDGTLARKVRVKEVVPSTARCSTTSRTTSHTCFYLLWPSSRSTCCPAAGSGWW